MRKLDTNTLVVTSNQFNDAQLNVNIYETLGEFQNVGDIHLPLRPHEKSEVWMDNHKSVCDSQLDSQTILKRR